MSDARDYEGAGIPIGRCVCASCGAVINPLSNVSGCPTCGSVDRLIQVRDEASLSVHEQLDVSQKRSGDKKPYKELKFGDDFHRKTSQWNWRERIIDRENDQYYERVKDESGNTIHLCDEPLAQHQGHGSARTSKKPLK